MMMYQYLQSLNGAGIAALSPGEWAAVKHGEPVWDCSTVKGDGPGIDVCDTRKQAIERAYTMLDGDTERETFYISCYDEDYEGQIIRLSEEEIELSPEWVEEAEYYNSIGWQWGRAVNEARG